MPIVLRDDLAPAIADVLAQRVRAQVTAYGSAIELFTSPHHTDDGYRRGPVWAPSSNLIEDGLH